MRLWDRLQAVNTFAHTRAATDPGPVEPVDADPFEQQPNHPLGHVEVGDGAFAQRADGDDVLRRAPDHLPGLMAHGQDFGGVLLERDHRRLVEDDAFALGVDEGVRRAEIDGEIPCQN